MTSTPGKHTSKLPKSAPQARPTNWPLEVGYIDRLIYSKALTSDERAAVLPPSSSAIATQNQKETLGPSPLIRIRHILSPTTHPALGQYGLFAARHLSAGTFIIHYLGIVHGSSDTDSNYDISLDCDLGVGIDAASMGNEARFINDYRGIRGEGPNAEFRETMVGGERRMSVYVLPEGKSGKCRKGIRKGEEICVTYGKGFWKGRLAEAEQLESVDRVRKSQGEKR